MNMRNARRFVFALMASEIIHGCFAEGEAFQLLREEDRRMATRAARDIAKKLMVKAGIEYAPVIPEDAVELFAGEAGNLAEALKTATGLFLIYR